MNIRQYYLTNASVFLNISIFSAVIAGIIFIGLIMLADGWMAVEMSITFLFVSILFFGVYLLNRKHAAAVPPIIHTHHGELFGQKSILLLFLPSPTLRILLFHPDGSLLGEITDGNRAWYRWVIPNFMLRCFRQTYLLTDHQDHVLAVYHLGSFFSNKVEMCTGKDRQFATYEESRKQSLFKYSGEVVRSDGTASIPVNISGFLQEFSLPAHPLADSPFVTFRKGYMPLDWGTRFRELNTPILTFSSNANKEEQLCVYGLCIRLFSGEKN